MNRTSLLITILIFAAIAAGFWFYQTNQKKQITPWDLISSDAIAAIEITDYRNFVEGCSSLPVLASLIDRNKGLHFINTTSPKVGGLTISLHQISADDFSASIFVPVSSINSSIAAVYHQGKAIASERTYNGLIIREYKYSDGQTLSITQLDDLILLSTSPLLAESAIRLFNANNAGVFRSENTQLFQLPFLQSDHGNIYVNSANFGKLLGLMIEPGSLFERDGRFGDGALVDLKIDTSRILLNGFVTDQKAPGLIASFNEQQPTQAEIWRYVSNRTAFVVEAKFSNLKKWINQYATSTSKKYFEDLEQRLKVYSILPSDLSELVGSHLVSCFVSKGVELGSVSFIETDGDPAKLEEIAFRVAEHKGDSLYHEFHGDFEIQMIDIPDFFFGIAAPLIPKGTKTYFTMIDDYLMISDDVDLIKAFLDDIAQEDTWGKSVDWSRYLRTTLQESNLNLYFDGRLTSLALRDVLNEKWRSLFDSTRLLGIEKGAVQVSHLDAVYYLNSVLKFERQRPTKPTQVITRFEFDRGLNRSATVVQNHDNKELELLIQDSLYNLQLFTPDLKRRWSVPLASAIKDQIAQIDFFRNGKLQYLFATDKELHLFDRLGRSVEGFPIKLPAPDIEFLRVVDYDRSKNYRFLLVDKRGNAYLLNKDGKTLDGWRPRTIGNGLIAAPAHSRVFGKDYFVAAQGNGTVHLMNRRGESVPGFPVALNARPRGTYAVQRGKDLASSSLVLVSEDGQKIQVDFKGQVTRSDVLPRFSNNSQFTIVKSTGGDAFVFFRTEGTRLAVIDARGAPLFETQNTGSDQWELQFVQTSLKQNVFCLFDKQQNFSYFFNEAGKSLLNAPLESDWMPTLMYDQKKRVVNVYNASGRSISTIPIPLD